MSADESPTELDKFQEADAANFRDGTITREHFKSEILNINEGEL